MSVTAGTLADSAAYELKDTSHTNWTEDELIEYINQATRAVMRQVVTTWPDYWLNSGQTYEHTANLVNGTANYNLPTDFYLMLQVVVKDSDGDTDIYEPINLERSEDSDAEGYLLQNEAIYLYPTPDANVTDGLTLRYVAIPSTVSASNDTVPLSTYFEDSLRTYVVLKAKARQEENAADFGQFYQLVRSEASAMISQTNTSDDSHGLNVHWRNFI